MDSSLSEFISESREILQRLSSTLNSLEKGAPIEEHIDAIYRDFHTLKGSAQLFSLNEIAQIAHALEAGFGPVRKFKLKISASFIDSVFKAMDLIERMVNSLNISVEELKNFEDEKNDFLPRLVDSICKEFNRDFVVINENNFLETVLDEDFNLTKSTENNTNIEVKKLDKTEVKIPEHNMQESRSTDNKQPEVQQIVDSTIRVQVDVLDRLMNLAGELVLVRNQVLQHRGKNEDFEFLNLSKSLDLVTSELQTEVMKTRMQPIGNVISKFHRVVRDLSKELNKKMDLTLQGAETELDKTLLENIKDPLTHIIRNSCDHGIELPTERKASGKPDNGHILIRAYHEGGQVVVEISDDGKGLDKNKLVEKAIEKGILQADKAEKISERDAFNLIFLPGFSTAKQVTAVSGRGVGMDVVKTNVEKIGGSVDLASRLGKGTTIKLKIPLTLAIVPALIVRSAGDRYAIPQVKLLELLRVTNESSDKIEYIQDKPTYRLRGSLLPLVYLRDLLVSKDKITQNKVENNSVNIAVLNAEGEKFGLVVDEVLDTTDIVVKPVSQFLKGLSTFSGATIMGDGTVSLILDIVGIAEQAKLAVRTNKKVEGLEDFRNNNSQKKNSDAQEFLLVRVGAGSIHAMPLCLVHRLEEFSPEKIEISGEKKVVQYRNSILPLIDVNLALKYNELNHKNTQNKEMHNSLPVIVVQKSNRSYGLIVNEILDVIMVEGQIDDSVRDRDGILGNLIHADDILVVIDALGLIDLEIESQLTHSKVISIHQKPPRDPITEIEQRARELKNKKLKILFAEDVAFFRKQVSKVLQRAGYEVVVAENGQAALKILEDPDANFSLILSDIEMPEMSGLELAKAVRASSNFATIPMIALTTKFKESDVKAGLAAGFDMYLEKLNEEKLLSGIDSCIKKDSLDEKNNSSIFLNKGVALP